MAMALMDYYTVEDVKALKEAVVAKLKEIAVKKGIVKSPNELVIRDLLPKDLGKDSWSVDLSGGVANNYNNVYDGTVSDKQIIAIIGVRLLGSTSNVNDIMFKRGDTAIKDIWDINAVKVRLDKTAYAKPNRVILYENDQNFKIDYYITATGTEEIQLIGIVAEPSGEKISEPTER